MSQSAKSETAVDKHDFEVRRSTCTDTMFFVANYQFGVACMFVFNIANGSGFRTPQLFSFCFSIFLQPGVCDIFSIERHHPCRSCFVSPSSLGIFDCIVAATVFSCLNYLPDCVVCYVYDLCV